MVDILDPKRMDVVQRSSWRSSAHWLGHRRDHAVDLCLPSVGEYGEPSRRRHRSLESPSLLPADERCGPLVLQLRNRVGHDCIEVLEVDFGLKVTDVHIAEHHRHQH